MGDQIIFILTQHGYVYGICDGYALEAMRE